MIPTKQDVEKAFFEAMAAGYAQSIKKTPIPDLPGSKAIISVDGHFRVVDYWLVTANSNKSTGSTTIWFDEQPVWVMHYGGWYDKDVIPFLKKCLHRAYVEERKFYGGRGPTEVKDRDLRYNNEIDRNDFFNARGEEFVYDFSGDDKKCRGFHWYRCMSLLP